MYKATNTFIGNIAFVAVAAWIVGLDCPVWSDVITASDLLTLAGSSFFSYVISATVGWGKVWYGVGYVISEIPWWMVFFLITE